VLTPSGGSMPTTINSAVYKRRGNIAEFWLKATVGTSTGTGSISVTGLPLTLTNDCPFFGYNGFSSKGLAGSGAGGSTGFSFTYADATFPGTTGAILNVYGACQTN